MAGTYTVEVGVFSATWQQWDWNSSAATITVNSSATFTSSAGAPSTVVAGGSASISVTVTESGAGGLTNANVELQIFNAAGIAVATQVWSAQNFNSGQSLPYSFTWTPAGTLAPGSYTIDIGVFDAGWIHDYYWNTDATITVTAQAPVLKIAKTHSGNFTQGQSGATYNVTVSNAAGAGPTSGTVTVTETVPTGMTLMSMAGSGWACPGTAANNCTRGDALGSGASYPGITVTVNVAWNAGTPLANSVSVSGGGSATSSVSDSTAINANPPVLSIAKSHTGNFAQGQNGATYSVMVSNASGAGPTSGTVTVTENVPAGLTLVSMSGTGWGCASNACTRSDALNPGSSYPLITVTVNVASNAPSQVTNQVSVFGGGSVTASASDVTTVTAVTIGSPTVVLETPANGAAVSGMIAVEGYAFASATGGGSITSVTVAVDGTTVGNAFYGVIRNDVCTQYVGSPGCPNVGFGFMLNGNTLTAGSHTVTVTATAGNSSGNTASAVAGATINVSSSSAGYYEIVNKNSGKVLEVKNGATTNGAGIDQWDSVGGANQHWQLAPIDNTYYRIVNQNSGKVLDVTGVSAANGASIQQWDYLGEEPAVAISTGGQQRGLRNRRQEQREGAGRDGRISRGWRLDPAVGLPGGQ